MSRRDHARDAGPYAERRRAVRLAAFAPSALVPACLTRATEPGGGVPPDDVTTVSGTVSRAVSAFSPTRYELTIETDGGAGFPRAATYRVFRNSRNPSCARTRA